jgi:oligopeptide/dipeptide ABC transporter ATP-binding protein
MILLPDVRCQRPSLLDVRDVHVRFPLRGRETRRGDPSHIAAVTGVSLSIAAGETLGLVGESGCGKSSLAGAIVGLTPVSSGTIHYDGVDVLGVGGAARKRLRRRVQLVFQDAAGSLNPRRTIGESIEEPLIIHRAARRAARRDRVSELLRVVGMSPDHARRYPHELSGGQRQRSVIARALALDPELLICDEPVSALDVSTQAQILNLLCDLRDRFRLTAMFISHDLAVVAFVSRRLGVMYQGRIVELGETAELRSRPRHPYTRELLAAAEGSARVASGTAVAAGRAGAGGAPSAPGGRSMPVIGEYGHGGAAPGGCPFHPRCPLATMECRTVAPRLAWRAGLSPTHRVACHYYDQRM